MKEIKHPDKKITTGAYSAGVEINGWLYISGQGPIDFITGQITHGSIEEETKLTMSNIGKILTQAGYTFADIVKCNCHLADINDFEKFNATYAKYFNGVLPARTTVQSTLSDGIKIEIDAIACKEAK